MGIGLKGLTGVEGLFRAIMLNDKVIEYGNRIDEFLQRELDVVASHSANEQVQKCGEKENYQ